MCFDVLSCSSECHERRYWRCGTSTVTSVSPSASSSATTSARLRGTRRSAHSTISSGTRDSPRRVHSCGELVGGAHVDGGVHGAQLVGHERPRVLDGARGAVVEPVDGDEHDVAAQHRRGGRGAGFVLELGGLGLVLPVEAHEQHHEHGHEQDDEPGALRELRDCDDDVDDERQERADAR